MLHNPATLLLFIIETPVVEGGLLPLNAEAANSEVYKRFQFDELNSIRA